MITSGWGEALLVCRGRGWPPIVEDEQLYTSERPQKPGVAQVAMSDGEVDEQPGNADVENRHVLPACLVAERTGDPAFAETRRAGDDEIAVLGDPVTSPELEEQRAVK